MIISHRHKYIFLKTRKTAGTSVELALSEFCGDRDIVTPLIDSDEFTRSKRAGKSAQNYLIGHDLERTVYTSGLERPVKKIDYYNHLRGIRVRNRIGRDVWNSYFKFSVARNPWDCMVSAYYWRKHNMKDSSSFEEMLRSEHQITKNRNHQIYLDNKNRLIVDQVLDYANLTSELSRISTKIGTTEPLDLPKAKSNVRPIGSRYQDYYTKETMDIVAELFAPEIELMNYRFER